MEHKKFTKEFAGIFKTAIATAVGLITAFAWRDVLTESVDKITTLSPIQGKLINAIIITIFSAVIIFAITKLDGRK